MSAAQSLPSFAQAFSSSSLSAAPISTALPPIQPRSPQLSRKRSRDDHPHNTDPPPPIKVEDRDDGPQSPPTHTSSRDSSTPPALSKKRRVTVSGAPHPPEQAAIPDDATRDQPRPTLKPKAHVDQRKGSISTVAGPGSLLSTSPPGDQLATSKLARIGRISPSTIPAVNRCAGNAVASGSQATSSSAPPHTPPPIIVSSPQQPPEPAPKPPPPAAANSLPPPPISFARRRAAQSGGRKKKPADIVISPRGAGPSDPLAPVIQSAPPVADRFPMAIPRLPLVLNNAQPTRRIPGNVPPTPTRFSLQGTAVPSAPSISSTARAMVSPPNPSVPIANTLVPPTPHALHHPGYTGDKSAFLAPFEVFYDALNDSKQLKGWLAEQLQKSSALMVSLKQQQDKMDEVVEDLVEKRTRVMREEITMLRQRMESLEEALLAVRAESSTREQSDVAGFGYPQGAKTHQNGAATESASSYRFPAPEQRRPDTIIRVTSPGREQERGPSGSPPVEVTRRLSVTATTARSEPSQLHGSFALGGHNRVASGSTKGTPSTRHERPSTTRQTDSRPAGRLYYAGSYGNGNPPLEGQTASRGGPGDKT